MHNFTLVLMQRLESPESETGGRTKALGRRSTNSSASGIAPSQGSAESTPSDSSLACRNREGGRNYHVASTYSCQRDSTLGSSTVDIR